MTEKKLGSTNSVPADIEFKLCNYKPKILDAVIKIRDSKPQFHFHDTSRNKAWNIDKTALQILISKLADLNVTFIKKTN